VEASSSVLVAILTAMLVFYAIQMSTAVYFAHIQDFGGVSLLQVLLSPSEVMRNVPVIIATLALPLALSWIPRLPVLHIVPGATGPFVFETIMYTGCVSLLAILITIEISLLLNITRFRRQVWRQILVAALALDIMTMFIYWVVIRFPDERTWSIPAGSPTMSLFMVLTFVFALLSSFLIILCVRFVGEQTPRVPSQAAGSLPPTVGSVPPTVGSVPPPVEEEEPVE
jgi:hypothetical protein